jgi:hypothetical protein
LTQTKPVIDYENFREVKMATLDHLLVQSCRFARAHIIKADTTLNRMQRNSITAAAENLFGNSKNTKRTQGHRHLIASRRAQFQHPGDFAIKITNDWQRVVNQNADARSEMDARLIADYRFLLRSQRDPEFEIVRKPGASKEIVDRLFTITR